MMRANSIRPRASQVLAIAAMAALAAVANVAPAAAQLDGLPGYVWGCTLVPDPPLASGPTTLELYGIYPTGWGELVDATVLDAAHVRVRLRSTVSADSSNGHWVARLPLGTLASGMHTVAISLAMERPDSAAASYTGSMTFEVVGGGSPPPPPPPGPPPPSPPPPSSPVLQWSTTDPYAPTPDQPMALILGGQAPFGCPAVTYATVVDTSHLALTLSPTTPCSGDSSQSWWSHRFELRWRC